jgi:hypothetical protein
VERLRTELDAAAQSLATGLETNPFAAIRDGQLELRRRDALELPEHVREIKRVIETHRSPLPYPVAGVERGRPRAPRRAGSVDRSSNRRACRPALTISGEAPRYGHCT